MAGSRRRWAVLGVLAALVLVAAGALWWFVLRDDAPPEAALPSRNGGTVPVDPDARLADGTWTLVPGDEVFAGYRIEELFGGDTLKRTAAGRTPALEGSLVVEDNTITEGTVTADVTQLDSGQLRRDRFITTGALETDTFPEATFVLTEPVPFPTLPAAGAEVAVGLTGELTMHGVTRPVTVDVDARWTPDAIEVAGGADIVLADWDIAPPDVPGLVRVDGEGTFEFVLVFAAPAG